MNHNLHIPRLRTIRHNPQWLLAAARWVGQQRRRIAHYVRLRRTGLHVRAAFYCALNQK